MPGQTGTHKQLNRDEELPFGNGRYEELDEFLKKNFREIDSTKGYCLIKLPTSLRPEYEPHSRKGVDCLSYKIEPVGRFLLPNDYLPCMWRVHLEHHSKGNFSSKISSTNPTPCRRAVERFEGKRGNRQPHKQTCNNEEREVFELMEDVLFAETPGGLGKRVDLPNVRYCTDIDTWDQNQLSSRNLPPVYRSVFEPEMQRNSLRFSAVYVPGIHRPYLYESGDAPGAIFTLHKEDMDLNSANYCIFGRKVWLLVYPCSALRLEEKIGLFLQQAGFSEITFSKNGNIRGMDWKGKKKDTNQIEPGVVTEMHERCSQWVRHQRLFVSLEFLDANDIKYDIRIQEAGDIILTSGSSYHQGFCLGRALNEAINLAPEGWRAEECTAKECGSECSNGNPIKKEMFRRREEGSQMEGLPDQLRNIYPEKNPWMEDKEGNEKRT